VSDPRPTPTHRRTVTIECFDTDDGLEVHGRLVDERPWAAADAVPILHDMELVVLVNPDDMTITDAHAGMNSFPHAECPSITPAFRSLIGLSVARGYTRRVQELLGREHGCSHLEFLARALGPAAIQAMASSSRRRGDSFVRRDPESGPSAWLVNTCHLWGEGGIGAEKMTLGWQPGAVSYPTPSLVELRRRAADTSADASA
jgi:hypothetical protein